MNDIDICIIMCPPLSKFPVKPHDISSSKIVNCPTCEEKMWFSKKKREMKVLFEKVGKPIVFGCHYCIEKYMKEKILTDENANETINFVEIRL